MKPIEDYDNHNWTIHSLNIHGTFFQRMIASRLLEKERINNVILEYPVEYPAGSRGKRGEESRLDIYANFADRYNRSRQVDLFIECKKANPEFVDWVFFPKFEGDYENRTVLIGITTTTIYENTPDIVFGNSRVGWDIPIADDARETRGDYKDVSKGIKTKSSNASITEASYQVVLATHAIAEIEMSSKLEADDIGSPVVFLPVIVTTANLFICEYDPADVSLDTGQIEIEKAKLQPIDKVIYRYPIPPHLQLELYGGNDSKVTNSATGFSRRDILVMNSKKFDETLSLVLGRDYSY